MCKDPGCHAARHPFNLKNHLEALPGWLNQQMQLLREVESFAGQGDSWNARQWPDYESEEDAPTCLQTGKGCYTLEASQISNTKMGNTRCRLFGVKTIYTNDTNFQQEHRNSWKSFEAHTTLCTTVVVGWCLCSQCESPEKSTSMRKIKGSLFCSVVILICVKIPKQQFEKYDSHANYSHTHSKKHQVWKGLKTTFSSRRWDHTFMSTATLRESHSRL